MTVIAFAASKGGVGKSTLCLLLASELAGQGMRTLVLDADPQHSSRQWAERTKAAGRLPGKMRVERIDTEKDLAKRLQSHDDADIVFVDVQGALNQFLTIAIVASDVAIVPARMSVIDMVEAVKIFDYGKALRRAPLRLLINGVKGIDQNTRGFQDALAIVRENQLPVFNTVIRARNVYEQFSNDAGSLEALASDPAKRDQVDKARKNIVDLLNEVEKLLETADA